VWEDVATSSFGRIRNGNLSMNGETGHPVLMEAVLVSLVQLVGARSAGKHMKKEFLQINKTGENGADNGRLRANQVQSSRKSLFTGTVGFGLLVLLFVI